MLKESIQNAPPISIRRNPSPGQAVKTILREHPLGEARRLNEMSSEDWREHLLLFSRVKNTVVKTNPNFYAPFKLEKGEPSPLGLFIESTFSREPVDLAAGKYALEYHYKHNRSIILCRITFQDTDGRIYRDVDLKGIGAVFFDGSKLVGNRYIETMKTENPGRLMGKGNYAGLLNRNIALYDYKMAEEFLKKGIRTCRALGIIELQEIIARNGTLKKLSLEEAVNEGILKKNFHPVVEVRAFGTKLRISNITRCAQRSIHDTRGRLMLEDAEKLVSQELGLKETMTDQEYLEWFAQTLGYNVGLMHGNGWEHHYLRQGHNITLDCRIVDLDGVRPLKDDQARRNEFTEAERDVLHALFNSVRRHDLIEETRLDGIFQKSYDAAFESGPKT